MKKLICFIIVCLLILPVMASCADIGGDSRINIVCTVFPIYDWLTNILPEDDNIDITLIIKNGTDPHSYSPSPADIAKISACDVLVYVGGESDAWVGDVIDGAVNPDMKEIKLLEALEEMRASPDVECFEEHCVDHAHKHEGAYDEHVWLSLKNAKYLCDEIKARLAEYIPDKSDDIEAGASGYADKLSLLDRKYADAVSASEKKTLLFADRFPFGYLTEDYGIEHFAAYSGCSADVEASFETVASLASKIDELELNKVIILENSNTDLAKTVISNSKCGEAEILVLDSLQSITASDIENGASYLSVMEKNLEVLKKALS